MQSSKQPKRFRLTNKLEKSDAIIDLIPGVFDADESATLYAKLDSLDWDVMYQYSYGKLTRSNRKMKWFSTDAKNVYAFSKASVGSETLSNGEYHPYGLKPNPFTPIIQAIHDRVVDYVKSMKQNDASVSFNSVLINKYEHGKEDIAWHADDDPWLGKTFDVLSVSFGATRTMDLRVKGTETDKAKDFQAALDKKLAVRIPLTSGSLCIMDGMTQDGFQHRIPLEPSVKTGRINLTFRQVRPDRRDDQPKGMHVKDVIRNMKSTFETQMNLDGSKYAKQVLEIAKVPDDVYMLGLLLYNSLKKPWNLLDALAKRSKKAQMSDREQASIDHLGKLLTDQLGATLRENMKSLKRAKKTRLDSSLSSSSSSSLSAISAPASSVGTATRRSAPAPPAAAVASVALSSVSLPKGWIDDPCGTLSKPSSHPKQAEWYVQKRAKVIQLLQEKQKGRGSLTLNQSVLKEMVKLLDDSFLDGQFCSMLRSMGIRLHLGTIIKDGSFGMTIIDAEDNQIYVHLNERQLEDRFKPNMRRKGVVCPDKLTFALVTLEHSIVNILGMFCKPEGPMTEKQANMYLKESAHPPSEKAIRAIGNHVFGHA